MGVFDCLSCATDENGAFHNENLADCVKTFIKLIPILDLTSDYWLIIEERSWQSEDNLELYAFYVFALSQFIMIWGSNLWWTIVLFKDEHFTTDCTPLVMILAIAVP